MSAKSKKPSPNQKPAKKRKAESELSQPFDKKLLTKAKKLAAQYTTVIRFEEGEYFGRTLEMPFVMADGPTPESCMKEMMAATTAAIARLYEQDKQPPQPASDEKRSTQVNVRLTLQEKFQLEEAARRAGFRGISDFVRNAALDKAS